MDVSSPQVLLYFLYGSIISHLFYDEEGVTVQLQYFLEILFGSFSLFWAL